MRVEIRADNSVHISGYVNVPGRMSRPVITPRGRVVETIEQRAFQNAIDRAGDALRMLVDHNNNRQVASVKDGTLTAREDEIGLRAEAVVTDPEVLEAARKNELRGWSFNMSHVEDELETRAEGLPLRRVKKFDMSEISLIIHANPCYSATSVEVRADNENGEDVELRALDAAIETVLPPKPQPETEAEKIARENKEMRAILDKIIAGE